MHRYILLLSLAFVSTKSESLFEPCAVDDLECLSTATETFLSKTYSGYPEWNIKPIDPLIVPALDINADNEIGIVFKFKNVSIYGLKNLQIRDFKLDLSKHSVLLKMKANIRINANIEIVLTKLSKNFYGDYSAAASAIGTSTYPTTLETINGTEYFVVGQESITCEIPEDPIVTLGDELQSKLNKDSDAVSLKPEWESKQLAIRKKVLCEMAKLGFHTIVHNLRASATKLPKTAFFKNI